MELRGQTNIQGKESTYLMRKQTWMEPLMSHLYKSAAQICAQPRVIAQMLKVASYKHLALHEAETGASAKPVTIH